MEIIKEVFEALSIVISIVSIGAILFSLIYSKYSYKKMFEYIDTKYKIKFFTDNNVYKYFYLKKGFESLTIFNTKYMYLYWIIFILSLICLVFGIIYNIRIQYLSLISISTCLSFLFTYIGTTILIIKKMQLKNNFEFNKEELLNILSSLETNKQVEKWKSIDYDHLNNYKKMIIVGNIFIYILVRLNDNQDEIKNLNIEFNKILSNKK